MVVEAGERHESAILMQLGPPREALSACSKIEFNEEGMICMVEPRVDFVSMLLCKTRPNREPQADGASAPIR